MITLTTEEWAEVYYALESKKKAIRIGVLGPDRPWEEQVQAIMDRIGPDGETAASEGVSPATHRVRK